MSIDPQIGQRIAGAARALNIARSQVEKAKSFEEAQAAKANLERCERDMIEASMAVNRGISRPDPSATA